MIAWLLFIPFFNLVDYFVTHDGGKPNYTKYNATKAIVGLACAFLWMMDFSSVSRFFLSGFVAALFEVTSFWVLYELIRNLWSRDIKSWKDLLYFDQEERDSGFVDRFFAYHGWTVHAWAKLAALILAIFSGILIAYL